jgi:hypothetical protein
MEDYYCENCGMLLDLKGDRSDGAIPVIWYDDDRPVCSNSCGRAIDER